MTTIGLTAADMKLAVKHTFLEFVVEKEGRSVRGRPRAQTDSGVYEHSSCSSVTTTPPSSPWPELSEAPIVANNGRDRMQTGSPWQSPWQAPAFRTEPTIDDDGDGIEEDEPEDFKLLPPMASSFTTPCGWWWMPVLGANASSMVRCDSGGAPMMRGPSNQLGVTNLLSGGGQQAVCDMPLAMGVASASPAMGVGVTAASPYAKSSAARVTMRPPGNFSASSSTVALAAAAQQQEQRKQREEKAKERNHFDKLIGAAFQLDDASQTTREPTSDRTTVMIRNLPSGFTRAMLLDMIDAKGFFGKYDFVYLPIDFSSGDSLGYAFVDLLTPEDAAAFFTHFDGLPTTDEAPYSVMWSDPHQGLGQHVERYRSSPVMHISVPDEWKPVIFVNGARVAFPPPTKRIKAPKIRSA